MLLKLIRVGGLAAVLAGPLLLVTDIGYELLGSSLTGADTVSEAAASTSFAIAYGLHLFGTLLLLVVLVGLYVRQAEAAGTLGLVGFLAALLGTGLFVGVDFATVFVIPNIAVGAPELLDAAPERVPPLAALLGVGLWLSIWGFGVGWALFGLATIRARVLPRAPAIALTIAALLYILGPPAILLGLVVFYLTLPWLGSIILRQGTDTLNRAGRRSSSVTGALK